MWQNVSYIHSLSVLKIYFFVYTCHRSLKNLVHRHNLKKCMHSFMCTLCLQEKKSLSHASFSSAWPKVYSWDGFTQASHGPQYTFRKMKWHKHNLQDFSPCHWSLNIVNSCVKVSVVVINKHAQRDLLFDKRSRSKCHLTECFWELPWSSVFVAMETGKLFSPRKKKRQGQCYKQWAQQSSI